MIVRRAASRSLFYVALLVALLLAWPVTALQIERERDDVRITAVDASAFPTVAVRVLSTAAGGAPIADLSRLVLRENGVPIPDTTLARTPVGVDVALVLDANADFLLFDDNSGLSRRDKVAAGLGRYAAQFMDPAGLDRVSIVVPDAAGGAAFLTQDANRPDDVAAAIAAFNPTPQATPLQAMMTAAISHLAATEEGRFQAILLYSDGARLANQLDYPALVEAAQAAGIPIYVAILGAEASPEETANADGLSGPTNGLTVPMPEPEAADPIYRIFQAQGQQAEVSYQSALRQSGLHEVSVSVGNVRDAAEFELALAAPEVALRLPQTTIRRAGSAVDTPLALLQPAVLPLSVQVTWPDGHPRGLTDITFRVDGTAQPLAAAPALDGAGQLPLSWDISERDAGTYRLEVEIADELSFRAASAPLEITIEVARPIPPTPTVAPTRAPSPLLSAGHNARWDVILPAALLLAGVVGAIILMARRRARRVAEPAPPPPRIIPASGPPDDRHVAVLERLGAERRAVEAIELTAADVTLGREAAAVDIVLDDPGVSRLHARIRRNQAGEYWLFDEGSAAGTFLNHEPLGLAPRPLSHNDVIQLGRVTLRLRLEMPGVDRRPPTADGGWEA